MSHDRRSRVIMSEYIPQNPTNESGDVIVPDEPDAFGWTKEAYIPDHESPAVEVSASELPLGDVPTIELSPEGKQRSERMAEAKERFGFLPQSYEELQHLAMIKMDSNVAGSASYLNKILMRQITLDDRDDPDAPRYAAEMPRRTMFRIVGQLRGYAANAGVETAFLSEAQRLVVREQAELGLNGFANANTLTLVKEWETQEHGVEGLRALVELARMNDATALMEGESDTLPAPESYFAYKHDADARARIEEVITSLRIHTLKTKLTERTNQQTTRRDFWITQLQDARKYSMRNNPVYIAATEALIDLKGISPEDK